MGLNLPAINIVERHKTLMTGVTGQDRARSRSPELHRTRHHDHEEEYYRSGRSYSRDASRKRYALDGIDSSRRHGDEDYPQSRADRTRGRSPTPTVRSKDEDRRATHRSYDDRKRGRSPSPSVTSKSKSHHRRSRSRSSSDDSSSNSSSASEDSRRPSKRSRRQSRSHSPSRSTDRSRSKHKSKRKDKERNGDKERDKGKKRKKRKDKERKKDKDREERRSVLTGKKIKLKVHKDAADEERDANRQDLLSFLNSAFE